MFILLLEIVFFIIVNSYATNKVDLLIYWLSGDLHARSPAWWSEDITTLLGTQIDSLTTVHGFKQIISDPTPILPQSSSCIGLIFTE